MTATLPVPVRFRLPDGWVSADPDQVGEPDVAFVAGHPASVEDERSAVITIGGARVPRPVDLAKIADPATALRPQDVPDLRVVERKGIGSPATPALLQVLTMTVDGRPVVRAQVYLSLPDPDDPGQRAVIVIGLRCTPGQYDTVIEDFRQLLDSLGERTLGLPADPPVADPDRLTDTTKQVAEALATVTPGPQPPT